uniref:Alpha 1,4-glycosyltransferase domain-containing protein n=1 Tax=Ananas comosus var. bracteatus TaxID=296719 RepID=A0A6V7QMG8_ANACO|nr:unnamed protein product [Ananas comosus var. bracteatus]
MCPSFPFLLAGTPAAPWFDRLRRGSVDPGDVPLAQNLSNLLRLLLLYKFGGVYVDADVLVLRSFARLRNAIGAQTLDPATGSWSRLNNAVMVFDKMHPSSTSSSRSSRRPSMGANGATMARISCRGW